MSATAHPQNMAEAVADLVDLFRPVIEAAQGLRVELEREGWSPTMAEQMAGGFYMLAIAQMAKGGEPS